jgi:hypothetical protein
LFVEEVGEKRGDGVDRDEEQDPYNVSLGVRRVEEGLKDKCKVRAGP